MSVLLEIEGLEVARRERMLVRDLRLRVEAGQCWAVLGPNGAGKSTLLHCLAGLHAPAAGVCRLDGVPIERLTHRERARRLGLLLQQGGPGLHNRVIELVLTGRYARSGRWWPAPEDRAAARAALADTGLEPLAERPAERLSGGELRRAEIARLLAQDPALALLDEPFGHLDAHHQVALARRLRERFTRPGHALMMVVHDPGLAQALASHCLLLDGEGGWQAGPAARMLTAERLRALFGTAVAVLEHRGRPLPVIDWAADDQSPSRIR